MTTSGSYGIGFTYINRLERGPYWSELRDEKGTYYRAPPGGYSLMTPEGKPAPGWGTMDGGIYFPNDPQEPPRFYRYFSAAQAPTEVPSESADCSTARYVKDPATSRVSLWAFGAGGAAGGTAGGIIGRGTANGSGLSYGQAAGAGAAGGMIGGLIVAALINSAVGEIYPGASIQDPGFIEQLRALRRTMVLVQEVPTADLPGQGHSAAETAAPALTK